MTMPQPPDYPDFLTRLGRDMSTQGWHFHRAPHSGPFDRFQVLGERGCGTNVTRKIIDNTLALHRSEALGWKHNIPSMIALPPGFLVICAVRAPAPWARSLYRRPWHGAHFLQALDFSTFIRTPWQGHIDNETQFEGIPPGLRPQGLELQWDRHPITGARYDTIFAMRNTKHRALLSLPARGASVAYVALEAFTARPRQFLEGLRTAFDLTPTGKPYRPIKRRMGNRWTPAIEGRAPLPDPLPQADLDWMHTQLDPQIETALGFAPTTA